MKVFSDYNNEEQQIIIKFGLCIFAEAKKINNKDEVATKSNKKLIFGFIFK